MQSVYVRIASARNLPVAFIQHGPSKKYYSYIRAFTLCFKCGRRSNSARQALTICMSLRESIAVWINIVAEFTLSSKCDRPKLKCQALTICLSLLQRTILQSNITVGFKGLYFILNMIGQSLHARSYSLPVTWREHDSLKKYRSKVVAYTRSFKRGRSKSESGRLRFINWLKL